MTKLSGGCNRIDVAAGPPAKLLRGLPFNSLSALRRTFLALPPRMRAERGAPTGMRVRGALTQIGPYEIDRSKSVDFIDHDDVDLTGGNVAKE